MKKTFILAFIFAASFTASLSGQNINKTMRRLPDTGQSQSFTNTYGEDSDYLIHPPYFIVHGNGTVTDTVTGLMWQQTDGGEMTIESAELYCENLVLGGFDDWRLPTAQESFSILYHAKPNPALDPAVFPDTDANYWWTGEKQTGNSSKIWVTNAGGGIGNHLKTETISAGGTKKFHIRAVRDAQPPTPIAERFTLTTHTALDNLTGLEWQRFIVQLDSDSIAWEQALLFAENYALGGKTDWRLPNIKELESINDESISQPSLSASVFPGMGLRKLWSSTSLPNQPTRAWYMDTRFGITTYASKTGRNFVLCVRGGNTSPSTGLKELCNEPLEAFPNPFSSQIQVDTPISEACGNRSMNNPLFKLSDEYGRTIYTGENIEGQDFSNLPAGFYFLNLIGNGNGAVRLFKL